MNINEQIEAYLGGSLGKEEMASFEAQLKQDPLLKKEFDLQKNIIDEIRDTRKADLKARLNRIDVSGLTQSSSLSASAIAAGVAIIAILAVGAYFLFFQEQGPAPSPAEEVVQPDTTAETIPEEQLPAQPEDDSVAEISEPEPTPETEAPAESIPENSTPVQQENTQNEDVPINTDELEIPQGLTDAGTTTEETAEGIDIPEMDIDSAIPSRTREIEIETRTRRRYDFHYAFEQDKLILYGDFSEEPYELIELKNDAGIMLFLYFKDQYYNLDKSVTDITPLEAVTSEQIIIKLDQLKGD